MTSEKDDIQQELRMQQKFSLSGVIGQQAGGAMKGASPVPKLAQVTTEILQFIDHNLADSSGALKSVLQRKVKTNELIVARHLDDPMTALHEIVQSILEKESTLQEFVRQVDVKWGQIFQERPHFQQPGEAPHPDDEYTHESVRDLLIGFMEKINKDYGKNR